MFSIIPFILLWVRLAHFRKLTTSQLPRATPGGHSRVPRARHRPSRRRSLTSGVRRLSGSGSSRFPLFRCDSFARQKGGFHDPKEA